MKTTYILSALALLTLPLAAQVSFTGSYTENFNSMGTAGTAPPTGWKHLSFNMTTANTTWTDTTGIIANGTNSVASIAVTVASTTLAATSAPTGNQNNGYNAAASSTATTDRVMATAPSSVTGTGIQAALTNATAATITSLKIAFDTVRFTAVSAANELPGYWVFISTNGTSWTNLTPNPTITTVPNTVGVTATTLTASGLSIAPGATFYVRWLDDNAVATSPDQIVGLNNVAIALPVVNALPTATLTAPAAGATFDAPATVNLAATATDSDGTISKVEFFRGAIKLGEDTTSPYESAWTNVLTGTYALTAVATDNLGGVTTSTPVNITVTNADNVVPTVSLTAPANGVTVVTSSVALAATAADTDGVVSKVEFFNGATKLGEDLTSPYTYDWASVATGNYTVTAVATDNDTATTTSTAVNFSVAVPISTTLVARRPAGLSGAIWKYLDTGTDQGTAWKEAGFNDSAWASGAAPLGYTDAHIVTTVNSPAVPNRTITTYFRRSFNVTGAAAIQSLNLNILRDDGVVVYINGTEVARQNMPDGTITYLTNSSTIVASASETTYFASTASPLAVLVEGANTIAVELHQRDGNSSDLGFDLEMISLALPGASPTVSITAPAGAATFSAPATVSITADADDSDGTVTKVEFFNGATKLGEDLDEPYSYDWTLVSQGSYILTAKATDNFGLTTTSALVNITVGPPNTIAPTVVIDSPLNNANFIAPASIEINATASDSDGTVTKVEFFNGATKLGEDTAEPYSFTWSNVAVGTYSLTTRATDNLTATATSAAVSITVNVNQAPTISQSSPANLASVNVPSTNLTVSLTDPENLPLTVTFYGREKGPVAGADFSVVTLPDTQFYTENANSQFPLFLSQTNWIVSSKNTLNTKFVAHMGDMTQNYNAVEAEFVRADQAMDIIEDPATTLLDHGIPWGGAPGNHDIGSGDNTSFWNQYFGISRWAGRSYFGGGYNNTSDQNYQFFSASGMDFIVINLKYNSSTGGNQAVMDWADALLKAYPNHRAIITSHWLISTGNPASWGGHGQAVYDNLKDNPNLFLMLCGHIHGEGRRSDTFQGRTVNTVLQDYQSRSNGGDSWLRYFTFKPSENKIYANTYKTNTGTFETDADSQFTLDYNMQGSAPWVNLGTQTLTAGAAGTSMAFTGLVDGKEYEWYAAVTDGVTSVSTSVRSFTAVTPPPLPTVTIAATDAAAGEFGADQSLAFTITRTGSTAATLTVPLTASGTASATDYSGFTSSVIIPISQASIALPLTVVADTDAEGPETITLSLAASADFTAGSPASANAAIADKPSQSFYFDNIADAAKRYPNMDADDDGKVNIIEYFMGTLPGDASSNGILTIPSTGVNTFKVRYPRAKNRPDVSGSLRWSSDLTNWHISGQSNGTYTVTFAEAVVSATEANPETVEATATVTGPGVAPQIFVRLGVD